LTRLLAAYGNAGLTDVRQRFYPDARHELVNDTNRDEVTRDVIAWMESVVGGDRPRAYSISKCR
jgi:alpha-beta hydrolase superfamily lysophospholipase